MVKSFIFVAQKLSDTSYYEVLVLPLCINLQKSSPTLNPRELNGLGMYTGCRAPESPPPKKKCCGKENIRWKNSGEATQEVNRCCAPGREGETGWQKMEAGS